MYACEREDRAHGDNFPDENCIEIRRENYAKPVVVKVRHYIILYSRALIVPESAFY